MMVELQLNPERCRDLHVWALSLSSFLLYIRNMMMCRFGADRVGRRDGDVVVLLSRFLDVTTHGIVFKLQPGAF
jgi:hypothetical protein